MLAYYRVVRTVARKIAGAVNRSVEDLYEGNVQQEPSMTDQMVGRIKECVRGFKAKGIEWSAMVLSDHGPKAQEREFGADLMGVLTIDLPTFKVAKGFLAQAKLVRNGKSGDLRELRDQCRRMLERTPASFVFLYYPTSVRVVPAISVVGSTLDPVELYDRSAQRFFEDHLECFIGDSAISVARPEALDRLARGGERARRYWSMLINRTVGTSHGIPDRGHVHR